MTSRTLRSLSLFFYAIAMCFLFKAAWVAFTYLPVNTPTHCTCP